MGEKVKPDATIMERHFGVRAHEDLGAAKELLSLWIEIPDYCHLQCDYCFASTKRGCPHQYAHGLNAADYSRLLDEFRSAGGRYLGIPGNGEPFHPRNRDLVMHILRQAGDLGLSSTVFTTGDAIFYSIDNGNYEAAVSREPNFTLAQELLYLGVILLVKFNSAMPEVQDPLVCQDGYTVTRERAMKWLIEMGFTAERHLGIVTSILPENKDEILSLYTYAEQNNLIFDCDTILPRGRGKKWKKDHDKIPQEEYRAIYQRLNAANGGHFAPGGSYIGLACDRVKHHLYVDIKGDVYPCIGCVGQDRNMCLGNVRKQSLASLWNHRFRVQLRDELAKTVQGVCASCENFEKTCWSCLGRLLESCEIADDEATLVTRGCFNHRPRLNQWMATCNREIRRLILRVGRDGYETLRSQCLGFLTERGMEALWSSDPVEVTGEDSVASVRAVTKDIGMSSVRLTGAEVWKWIRDDGPPHAEGRDATKAIAEDDRRLAHRFRSLLPVFLIPTLKIIADRYDRPLNSRATAGAIAPGLLQFCLFMFYMPERKRYFYRSVSFNRLDEGSAERLAPLQRTGEDKPTGDELGIDCRRNSRRVRLVQRWAEALREGEEAPILPFIRNLSRDMEQDFVNTYELVLCRDLFAQNVATIDREQRFYPNRHILGIGALLDTQAIAERSRALARAVDQVVDDESVWKRIEATLSHRVFAWESDGGIAELTEVYGELAAAGFYDPTALSAEEKAELRVEIFPAVLRVLTENVWLFPEGSEKGWFEPGFVERLAAMDSGNAQAGAWRQFFEVVLEHRRENRLAEVLPNGFEPQTNQDSRKRIVQRLYSRLLVEFLRLFRDNKNDPEDRKKDETSGWVRAVNYFIWLAYLRNNLGVRDYFVLHAPNLQQQCSLWFREELPRLPASGMILSSSDRLPSSMREECEELFRTIVSPIEELSFAHINSERSKAVGFQQGEFMISHEMDTPIGVLNRDRSKLSQGGRLAVDYLELWRRQIKRDWSDAMPPEMNHVYRSKGALLEAALRLGYERALRRSKVPRHVVNGRLRFWEPDELLRDLDRWLDVSIELPEDIMSGESGWVFQAKTWLMFQLIDACHHAMTYAFEKCRRFDDWAAADALRRARLELSWSDSGDGVLSILLVNTGSEERGEREGGTQGDGVLHPIRSSHVGIVRMPFARGPRGDADRRRVTVWPSQFAGRSPEGAFCWEARIEISKEGAKP